VDNLTIKKNGRWDTKEKGQELSIYNETSSICMFKKPARFFFTGVSDGVALFRILYCTRNVLFNFLFSKAVFRTNVSLLKRKV
jgi:hypothetical protein